MKYHARMIRYSVVEFQENKCLWTALELQEDTIPGGLHNYDLEFRSQKSELLQLVEGKVDEDKRHSTLLSVAPLYEGMKFPVKLKLKESPTFCGGDTTLQMFASERGIVLGEPEKKIDIWPIDYEADHTLFRLSDNHHLMEACVGHLRGDFSPGVSGHLYTTWWPHHDGKLQNEQFDREFNETVNRLRDNGPLHNMDTMHQFCSHMEGGCIGDPRDDWFGYRTESENYLYFLRCRPMTGDYNTYLYAYDKAVLEPLIAHRLEAEQETGQTMGGMG